MSLVVGLDIGSRSVTGAVFSGSAKKFRLVDFFVEEIPEISSGEYAEDGEYIAPLSVREVVDRALSSRKLKTADIVAAVDAKDCVIREINVPFTRDEQIRKTVFFEAESHFTGFDLESTVLEYIKIGEHDEKSRLILTALRDDLVAERLTSLKELEVDPISLDLDAAALFNAYAASPLFDTERSSLLLDLGATSTRLVVVDKGKIRKIRAFRLETAVPAPVRQIVEPATVGAELGGDGREVTVEEVGERPAGFADFSIEERFQEIESALRLLDLDAPSDDDGDTPIAILSDEEYDRVREEEAAFDADPFGPRRKGAARGAEDAAPASTDADADADSDGEPGAEKYAGRLPEAPEAREFDFAEYLQRVGLEVQRSMVGLRLESPIELICLTGGMSRRPEAQRFFSDEFDIETVPLEFAESIPSDLSPADRESLGAQGAVAVGLALKQFGKDQVGLDFRKGPYRYERRFERLKVPLLVGSILLFAICLQATFWAFHAWKLETRRLEGFRAAAVVAYREFFDALPKGRPLPAALAMKKQWEGKGAGEVGRYLEATEAILDFGEVLRGVSLRADPPYVITSMDFKFKVSLTADKGPKGPGGKPKLIGKGERSQVTLETGDPSASVALESAFNDSKSKYFSATADARPLRGDMNRVTLFLEVKDSKLAEFTQ